MDEPEHTLIRRAVLSLLEGRRSESTICPSEAARHLFPEDWRDRMATVREVAFRMAEDGEIVVRQKGAVVNGREAKGPIRLGRGTRFDGG